QAPIASKPAPRPPAVGPDLKTAVRFAPKVTANGEIRRPELGVAPASPKPDDREVANGGPGTVAKAIGAWREIVFDVPTPGGALHAAAADYKVRFADSAWTFVARPPADDLPAEPIAFELAACDVGGSNVPVGPARPTRRHESIEYARGGLVERIELRADGVEQSFRFDSLPARGELRLAIATHTALAGAATTDGGLLFRGRYGDVRYSGAVAIDATGRRVAAPTRLENGEITIRVPADFVERAALPLVVDPLVNGNIVYANTARVSNADIVWDESSASWAAVLERHFSADDVDVYLQRLDADMNLIGPLTAVDSSFDVWQRPRIANMRRDGRFLVVAQVSTNAPAPYWIAGRIIDNLSQIVTGQFDIARSGVAGHFGGDKFRPDVAGDPHPIGPTWFTVVWERQWTSTDHDIHLKQVASDGTLRSAAPTIVDGSIAYESNPAISNSVGPEPAWAQFAAITYQRTYSSTDEDIHGALVSWDGQLHMVGGATNFPINQSAVNDITPQVSTSTPANDAVDRQFLFVYHRRDPLYDDILGSLFDGTGIALAHANLTALENDPIRLAWPQALPTVDCDGVRFAVGYQELYGGTGIDSDTRISLFGVDRSANTITIQEPAVWPGSSTNLEYAPRIASRYASSGALEYGYAMVQDLRLPTAYEIEVIAYDGYVPNGGYASTAAGCGNVTVTPSGPPILGQTVDFTVSGNHPISGFVFGVPMTPTPIAPCPSCTLAVSGSSVVANPLSVTIPPDISYVGVTLAVQGFTFAGGPCFGQISASNRLEFTIQ
ncbi:MAG: hypothetical protein KDE27_29765, partial [Planctomycetes bacterium]|nr:hypothetical protein [Planctomycetota bacterium]